jgi:hypothetical protein
MPVPASKMKRVGGWEGSEAGNSSVRQEVLPP